MQLMWNILRDGRIGTVVAVLGPALGLGDPDGLAILADRMIDVGGQVLVGRQLLAPTADGAVHDEALVQPHQVADEGLLQQVVADGDPWRWQTGVVDGIVDESRVHHDVAVVGQEQIGTATAQAVDARVGHAVRGLLDGAIHIGFELVLQGRDAADLAQLLAQAGTQHGAYQPAESLLDNRGKR
ncbi:hypothetical protein Q3H58_003904 [Pseudomonas psychrotolerans]|nr:hypothetical protein [Pseudomonas psychrotolerans]